MLTKMLPIIAILFLPLFLSLSSATIIVGIDENYPPHEFVEDGSVRGFNVDIIEAIAKEINETVEFKPMKWHDAVEALKNESIDALFMAKHKERLQYFDFSQPILDLKLAIFVKNNVYGIATIYDLAGHTVAVEKGDISFVILKQEVPDAIIIAVENQSMAIDLVEDGDAKAFFGNYYTGLYLIGKKGYKDLKIIGEEINIGKRCIAVKKGNIALLKKINEGIKKIKESGEYDAIYKKWFGQQIYKEYFPKWIFYLLLGLVLSIGGGAGALSLWNYTLKKKLDESTKEIVSYKNYLESILENAPIAIL
ncbi:MAG TPA: transporter substrate-binding domain-containing protein, partial [Thermoplasmatales archaeon]|nr:transporter substrate-binding domain-containing protein [Thermoplasmatales archaeon]